MLTYQLKPYLCYVKKSLVFIITFIYMSISTGIAMEIHYCMGKRVGVELFASGNDKCGRCGMTEKKGGCCSDEHKFYKLTTDQKTVSNDYDFHSPATVLDKVYYSPVVLFARNAALKTSNNSHPPGGPPLFILNCIYRL